MAELLQGQGGKHVPPYFIAMIHASLGKNAESLDWLQKAIAERSPWIPFLRIDPRVDALRSDPGFQELAGRWLN